MNSKNKNTEVKELDLNDDTFFEIPEDEDAMNFMLYMDDMDRYRDHNGDVDWDEMFADSINKK